MINSAEEFMRLRSSQIKVEYDRSALEEVPIEVWYELVNDHPDYRRWVIHNKTVPLEILEYLSVLDPSMKGFIARKRKLSQELFERLSVDPKEDIRLGIATNRKAPLSILEILMGDRSEDVARCAKNNYSERTKLRDSMDDISPSHLSFEKSGKCPICNGRPMGTSSTPNTNGT